MNLDIPILVGSIVAIVMVFVLPRPVIFGPLICAWIGAAIGVSLATMYHYDAEYNRVYIENSLPLFGAGLMCGMFPGFIVMAIYEKRLYSRGFIEVLAVTIIFTSVGAMIGTQAGKGKHVAAIYRGTGGGAIFGLFVGLIQWRFGGRKKASSLPVRNVGNETPMNDS